MSAAMTPERRAHLEQVIATARCAGELHAMDDAGEVLMRCGLYRLSEAAKRRVCV